VWEERGKSYRATLGVASDVEDAKRSRASSACKVPRGPDARLQRGRRPKCVARTREGAGIVWSLHTTNCLTLLPSLNRAAQRTSFFHGHSTPSTWRTRCTMPITRTNMHPDHPTGRLPPRAHPRVLPPQQHPAPRRNHCRTCLSCLQERDGTCRACRSHTQPCTRRRWQRLSASRG